MSTHLLTPKGRVSYPYVFKGKANALREDKRIEFSVDLIFSKDTDLSKMKEAMEKCIKDKWGDKRPANLRTPFKDGNSKNKPEYKDSIYITFKNTIKPGLVDAEKNQIISERDFYPGCYAHVNYNMYAYDAAGNKGLSMGLLNIQKLADGEPFGAGIPDAEDVFTAMSADNPENYLADNSDLLT